MTKRQIATTSPWKPMMHSAFALGVVTVCMADAHAQSRNGRAAYHLHTSELVTAARYEPHGSVLKVTNPETGRTVNVRVNDRGPFNGNRILDLSTGAFRQLYGGLGRGVGPVQYEVISRPLASRSGRRVQSTKRRTKKSGKKSYRRTRRSAR
jgi:rare lipoprotein A